MPDNKIRIELVLDAEKGTIQMRQFSGTTSKELEKIEASGTRSADRIRGAWGRLRGSWVAITGTIAAVALSVKKLIGIGSQYEQSTFQMKKTFGDAADDMINKAYELSSKFKDYYSFNEISYAFTKTADSMERYGITGEKYLSLVTRAGDIGAAKGLELKESIDRVESAMRGEAEASEYLGVTLNDTYMKNMAFNGELKDSWEKLTDNEKALLRYYELMKQTGKYTGSASDATETLAGKWKQLTNIFREKLEPALKVAIDYWMDFFNLTTKSKLEKANEDLLEMERRLRMIKETGGELFEAADITTFIQYDEKEITALEEKIAALKEKIAGYNNELVEGGKAGAQSQQKLREEIDETVKKAKEAAEARKVDKEKEAAEEKKYLDDRRNAYRQMYATLREFGVDDYEFRKSLIEKQAEEYKEALQGQADAEALINEWRRAELTKLHEERFMKEHEVMDALRESWGLTFEEIRAGGVNVWDDIGNAVASVTQSISSAFTDVIIGSKTAEEAGKALFKSLLAQSINTLIQIGIQELILSATQKKIRAASAAATIAEMGAIATAAAPAAMLTSIATGGASSASGAAAFTAAMGSMTALTTAIIGTAMASAAGMSAGTQATPMAEGGLVTADKLYLVGERGPELFIPGRSGEIISNDRLDAGLLIEVGGIHFYGEIKLDADMEDVRANIGNAVEDAIRKAL